MHTLNKRAKGEGGFPFIPVIIGVLLVEAVGTTVGVLFSRGVLSKKVKKTKKTKA